MTVAKRARRRESASVFSRVKSKPLAMELAHELISAVLQGAFQPGDFLPPEDALCDRFAVSRPVVRDALKLLANIGMVRTRQGQGSLVLGDEHWNELAPELVEARCSTGTAEEVINEVIELRLVLEARAAEHAASRVTPGDLEQLRGHVAAMRDALDDPDEFLGHDLAFHREILRLGGNRMVLKLFDLLEPMLLSARSIALEHQKLPEGMIWGADEHERIIEALASGSAAEASDAISHHLAWVKERVGDFDEESQRRGETVGS